MFATTQKISLTFMLISVTNLQSSFLGMMCHKISFLHVQGSLLNLWSWGALPFRGEVEESKGISCQPCRCRSRRSDDSWGKPAALQEVLIEMIERWMHLEMHPINQVNTSWIHQHQPCVFAMHHLPAGWSIITARVGINMDGESLHRIIYSTSD